MPDVDRVAAAAGVVGPLVGLGGSLRPYGWIVVEARSAGRRASGSAPAR